jgi:hypothetical protein
MINVKGTRVLVRPVLLLQLSLEVRLCEEDLKLVATEGTFTYHTMQHKSLDPLTEPLN